MVCLWIIGCKAIFVQEVDEEVSWCMVGVLLPPHKPSPSIDEVRPGGARRPRPRPHARPLHPLRPRLPRIARPHRPQHSPSLPRQRSRHRLLRQSAASCPAAHLRASYVTTDHARTPSLINIIFYNIFYLINLSAAVKVYLYEYEIIINIKIDDLIFPMFNLVHSFLLCLIQGVSQK